jgi:hypothetical protein
MPINYNSLQTVHVKFFDPVTNPNVNFLALDIRKVGIYTGGYLTRANDTTAILSAFTCEIADSGGSGNQVRVSTSAPVNVVVGTGTPLVVLRWTYSQDSTADYLNIGGGAVAPLWTPTAIALGTQLTTDVIVGVCQFSGTTLQNEAEYTLRTNPFVFEKFLKVEAYPAATTPAVRIRSGRVNYGSVCYDMKDTLIPLTAPATAGNPYVALIQITTAGALLVTYGDRVNPTPNIPVYGGLFTAAEITLAYGQTIVTDANIRDVRSFVSNGTQINVLLPSQSGNAGKVLTTDGANVSWTSILPSISGNNGKFLRVNAAGTAVEWAYVTYAP